MSSPVVLGVIPARGGSKGLLGKNLRILGGVPLICHAIRNAQGCSALTDFVVSTDDPEIARVSRIAGAPVPFLRPIEMSRDESPVWPAVRHALLHWERKETRRIDILVLLQPTSPLRRTEDIVGCLKAMEEASAEACLSVTRAHDNPLRHLIEFRRKSAKLIHWCSPSGARIHRRQDCSPVYIENGAVYAICRKAVMSMESLQELRRVTLYEMPRSRSVDIDEEDDLALAEFWMSRLSSQP